MLSDKEEVEIAESIAFHRKEIFKIIDSFYENNDELLTKHCENMNCEKCKIGKEIAILQAVKCWTTSNQFRK